MPPRSLKSIVASVAFPAFRSAMIRRLRIIGVSYGSDLAIKHANDFRADPHLALVSAHLSEHPHLAGKNTEAEIATTRDGFRLATSVDGTLTGRGGDIIIIDDPLKPSDALSDSKRERVNEWFNNTLLSRLDDKQSRPHRARDAAAPHRRPYGHAAELVRRMGPFSSCPAIAEEGQVIRIGEASATFTCAESAICSMPSASRRRLSKASRRSSAPILSRPSISSGPSRPAARW